MSITIYGHPWSINTRKTLATLAEKGNDAELALVMIPRGEHKQPAHVARHPWGKVPVLDHDGFWLYETRAINRYLDASLPGPSLTPRDPRAAARVDQWTNVADAYFVPHAGPMIVELLFRRYLGGETDRAVVDRAREAIQQPLDVVDRWLGEHAYLAGDTFSLADLHWMPYLEYLARIGEGDHVARRPNLDRWWRRVGARAAWEKVARSGPQPDEPGMTADVIETRYR
jgi:glutathione S-transferase